MKTNLALLAAALLLFATTPHAETGADPLLAKALAGATVSLEQAIAASAVEGEPISAKYELEVDGLQLSVYTMSGESYKEVIVDYRTGRIGKVIAITDLEDLRDAREQKDIIIHAKRSLKEAASEAVANYSGYRAVSAMPAARDGRLVAEIRLTNGKDWRTVLTPLTWEE